VAHIQPDFSGNVLGTVAALTYSAAVKFKVEYVAGFSDDTHGYSYFLTVQPRVFYPITNSPSSETESKLVQVADSQPFHTSVFSTDLFCLQISDRNYTSSP